jgi:hypothetical protein
MQAFVGLKWKRVHNVVSGTQLFVGSVIILEPHINTTNFKKLDNFDILQNQHSHILENM